MIERTELKGSEQRKNISRFIEEWRGKGYEKGETQRYWIALLRDILGVKMPDRYIEFERQVKSNNSTTFIDGYIKETKVLIEQKNLDVDLDKKQKQSDGSFLTPYEQAFRYAAFLPYSEKPRWIIVCNFEEIRVHDTEHPGDVPEIIRLEELETDYYRLKFLVDSGSSIAQKEMEISLKAGEMVGAIYEALLDRYYDKSEECFKSLNKLCVRLVFCLYAEDAGLFSRHGMFHDYLSQYEPKQMRDGLIKLFKILNTKEEDRDRYENEDLLEFPYVNGGLFADEEIKIPQFTDEIAKILLSKASEGFDWSEISPTIFGAVFESTLNPETRRKGGMHYTSVENIHKVIDPLFLNDLRNEFSIILNEKNASHRTRKLKAFQEKLSKLKFLDPACGSGNFLTETYLCLRRLENDVIRSLLKGQSLLGFEENDPVKVKINQFYGIEINDFAVSVAQTALWIAESQMLKETEDIINRNLDFLPLKSYTNIQEGNALQMDWENVVEKDKLDFIMGNPPFLGAMNMTKEQRKDIAVSFEECEKPGEIDYVSGWFAKSAKFITNTEIQAAFVSTNSLSQGQQVALLWKPLTKLGVEIDFAYRTFVWDSEATSIAHVHCVIIGFSFNGHKKLKTIFDTNSKYEVLHINGYLLNAPDVFIENRSNPLDDVSPMRFGSMARDGGNLFISSEERDLILKEDSEANLYVRRFIGADELINNRERWCLWLDGVPPSKYVKNNIVMDHIKAVRDFRLASVAESTRKFAQTPHLFCQIAQPNTDYIVVPRHSSEKRKYIPMAYVPKDVICGDANLLIPNANKYEFSVLMSSLHNCWMRVVAGRLEMRYRYSKDIVYNNFPWPDVSEEDKKNLGSCGERIIEARNSYEGTSLADLYGENMFLYDKLMAAHKENDKAVLQVYGLSEHSSEEEIISHLMKLYVQRSKKAEHKQAVDIAISKVTGKKNSKVPEWLIHLQQLCLDGVISVEEMIEKGKAKKKELAAEEKKAKILTKRKTSHV